MISPPASRSFGIGLGLLVLAVFSAWQAPARAIDVPKISPDPGDVARRVDALLDRLTGQAQVAPAEDASFLRRLKIDLTGQIPDPEEARAFLADPDPDRRAKWADRFLASDAYATNWGRYW